MKDQFAGKFLIGNIMNPNVVATPELKHHFNILTAENNMKPGYLSTGNGSYSFGTADTMVNQARAAGFKVVGHTLLWHSQNASWMSKGTLGEGGASNPKRNDAINMMKTYISGVVGHFKGKIHSWDVLNEVFPDGGYTSDWKTSMRSNNPWFAAIGPDFVYEGFLAARLADPDAILYYNDYNTDMSAKANKIRDMVLEVNNKYLQNNDRPQADKDSGRLLIEGIGMQEHHNTGVSASNIKTTLNTFKSMSFTGSSKKIIISVSELDVLCQQYNDFANGAAVKDAGRAEQAKKYGEYMAVYLEFSDIIERVSLWGVTDDKSWRAKGEPLLFNKDGLAKQSYYSFVGALK